MKIKNKFTSFAVSVGEKAVMSIFSSAKRNIVETLESAPDNTAKLFYAYTLLIFIVVVTAMGAIVVPIGLITVLVTLFDKSVDKVQLIGILTAGVGILYMFGGIFLLKTVGGIIKSSVEKSTRRLVKKIEK